ncbi:MAG: hypothetical protein IJI90_06250 [Carnobacterium sp.]|uniref:DUF1433 domain-containing protein n=3 Tax=Pseudolactococcus TaxID=3436058 RepID=A0A0D6DWR9_9LACT|nr:MULTISPECIES: hypothetical protein [Lactobacillales]CEN28435.1 Uncharacterized protein LACPI_1235 [Lactococcus piscium MKFS47]MBQ6484589.1 hypothetical protein [Carnobacterium sp.]MCJ1972515.1 hypothetical protein [Lactococcus carnosus]MCJ1988950.1 hypothetical protein [Lactococcus carnosus]MCJ2001435.1 hypothetical protein [Lactococcus carnosus]
MKRAINKWVISIFAIIMLLMIGIEGKTYMDNDKKKYNAQQMSEIVEMERIAAKQIKNTFLEIEEITFSEKYKVNKLTGFTNINVEIISNTNQTNLGISLPSEENSKYLTSYMGKGLKKGVTEMPIKITFSDKTEGDL